MLLYMYKGLGVPFIYLPLFLLGTSSIDLGDSIGEIIWKWIYLIVGYNVVLSVVIGFVIGYIARKVLRVAESR